MKLKLSNVTSWIVDLEKDSGILHIGKPEIPKTTCNLVVNIPVIIQVDPNGIIHGMFIESAQYQFERVFGGRLSKWMFK